MERTKAKRLAAETKPENVTEAESIIQNFLEALQIVFDTKPELTCSVFRAVNAKLTTAIKEDRDVYLNGTDGKANFNGNSSIDIDALLKVRVKADALFNAAVAMDVELDGLPVEVSKTTGKPVLKLTRMPKGSVNVDRSVRTAITKKMLWTVDGTQFPNYSISMMRKVISPEAKISVDDIKDALGFNAKGSSMGDGKIHSGTLNGKVVTFQAVGTLSPEEVVAVDVDDDEGSED